MAAVMSSSPVVSPAQSPSPGNQGHPALHPLITSPLPRSNLQRPLSHASKSRLSQYSMVSDRPSRSRPTSHVFTAFHSSLPYTLVRDFAYAVTDPMHYGPPPEPSRPPSRASTPASEAQHSFSDPPTSWDSQGWDSMSQPSGLSKGEQLAPIQFSGDGPPWSEDEDLQSPVVVSSRHKKHKSSAQGGKGRGRNRDDNDHRSSLLNPDNYDKDRGYYAGSNGDGSERYYVGEGGEANGPGGEIVTYPASQARRSLQAGDQAGSRRDSHFAGNNVPTRTYTDNDGQPYFSDSDMSSSSSPSRGGDESRYSRNYQFSIASPDEEMHGKAVALFDFERENENELPLVEGQIIWVSYRHGMGWLVAEDPKTGESGLVPEEYVRLLRDIQGGLSSLTGQVDGIFNGNDTGTPTQAEPGQGFSGHSATLSNGSNTSGYQQPIVSTFSTSSKDLQPYPQHLLGTKEAGATPPQVSHYHGQRGGSQANTPTVSNPESNALKKEADSGSPVKANAEKASTEANDPASSEQKIESEDAEK